MRVGFIFPSSDYLYDPFRGDPHTHFQILTVLEERFDKKVELSLIDLRGIKREFSSYHIDACDLYLYSTYTLDINEQLEILKGLRKRYPKAKHIAGGPHATVYQADCEKLFDALIIGDGEEIIVQAIQDLMQSKLKKIYQQELPVDINDYPYPRRHFLPAATVAREKLLTLKYQKGYDKLLGTTVIFSRGCPYGCYFCDILRSTKYAPGIRYRSPKHIEAEIEYLKRDYGVQGISLLDEIGIPLKREQAIPYLEAIGRTNITWRGQCRVDGMTPEYAKLAKASGCVTMCLGVESVSQPSLDMINKHIDVEQSKRTIQLLKSQGIETRVYMILGLPAEPKNIVEQTWRFIKETEPTSVYLSLFTVRPGTKVFTDPKLFGIERLNVNWDKTMHMYGRYEKEIPELTFAYAENAPWGKSFSQEELVNNYLSLQTRIKENGYGPI